MERQILVADEVAKILRVDRQRVYELAMPSQLCGSASASIGLMPRPYGNGLTEVDRQTQLGRHRKAARVMHPRAQSLSAQDLALLEKSFITADLAEQAGIFRVDSQGGAELVGRNGSADYSGLVFPFYWPGGESPREYRLRRDTPDLEEQPDGSVKEKGKYLSPPSISSLGSVPDCSFLMTRFSWASRVAKPHR